MDEGAFDRNFVWYEWGFVRPDEMPRDEPRVPAEVNGAGTGRRLGVVSFREVQQWDEEHRWPAY